MKRIYVASSWRNAFQPEVVHALRAAGHQVYDFRNPRQIQLELNQYWHTRKHGARPCRNPLHRLGCRHACLAPMAVGYVYGL